MIIGDRLRRLREEKNLSRECFGATSPGWRTATPCLPSKLSRNLLALCKFLSTYSFMTAINLPHLRTYPSARRRLILFGAVQAKKPACWRSSDGCSAERTKIRGRYYSPWAKKWCAQRPTPRWKQIKFPARNFPIAISLPDAAYAVRELDF